MKIISKLKKLPLLTVLISVLGLTPAIASAGSHDKADQVARYSQSDKHNRGHSADHRPGRHGAAQGRNHRDQLPHIRGQHNHSGRQPVTRHHHNRYYHTRQPVRHPHHHRHTRVHNYYQQHAYVTDNPRLILGLQNDNVSIFYRNH